VLDGIEGAGAAELNFAHVADVEEADTGADGDVFGDEAGVFDGHVPAAEVNHPGFVMAMAGIEGGGLEGGGGGGQKEILSSGNEKKKRTRADAGNTSP
jgi:hypothetical protein